MLQSRQYLHPNTIISPSEMTTQKAIVIKAPKKACLVSDRPLPRLRNNYILVESKAVALNPTDWKHIDFSNSAGILVGCDYAGVVKEVGSEVTKPFKKGDRIAGFVHGANSSQPEDGTFAEHIVVKGNIQMHIPESMTFEQAATLGVGMTSVGQGLYQALALPVPKPNSTTPTSTGTPILIYGGSTASGVLGIQFAKLSGYAPIVTCSPHNFDMVKELGAVAVFDYHDDSAAEEISEYTEDNLKLVWDTIATPWSAKFCAEAISSDGGKYAALLPIKCPRDDVQSMDTLAYTVVGEPFNLGPREVPASLPDYEFGKMWWDVVEALLREHKIQPHKIYLGKDGLKGVVDGLQLLREGKISGEKLVYRVDETP